MSGDEELVMVPVFRRDLAKVYAFIGALHQDAVPVAGASGEGGTTVAGGAETSWTVEELRRFAGSGGTMNVVIGKVMDELASKPGAYFSTGQLEAATGVARKNLRGSLSSLTRHVNTHYAGLGWPFVYHWGPQLGAAYPAEAHYVIDEATAKAWREARSS